MYDGVAVHGLVHQLRMEEVFWGRLRIFLKFVDVVLVALPPPASQERADAVMRAWRDLNDAVYVGRRETREERDKQMLNVLLREVKKNYEVTPLEEG